MQRGVCAQGCECLEGCVHTGVCGCIRVKGLESVRVEVHTTHTHTHTHTHTEIPQHNMKAALQCLQYISCLQT